MLSGYCIFLCLHYFGQCFSTAVIPALDQMLSNPCDWLLQWPYMPINTMEAVSSCKGSPQIQTPDPMTVLVTGAAGFIGYHAVIALHQHGHGVTLPLLQRLSSSADRLCSLQYHVAITHYQQQCFTMYEFQTCCGDDTSPLNVVTAPNCAQAPCQLTSCQPRDS
jgi:hypothetical protein